MMPLRPVGTNTIYRMPTGGPEIHDLPVVKGNGVCVSRWEPTPAELAILLAGGCVELAVMGEQPPVSLRAVPAAEG